MKRIAAILISTALVFPAFAETTPTANGPAVLPPLKSSTTLSTPKKAVKAPTKKPVKKADPKKNSTKAPASTKYQLLSK